MLTELKWKKKKLWNNLTKISHDSEHIMVHHTQFSFPASFLIDREKKWFLSMILNIMSHFLGSRNHLAPQWFIFLHLNGDVSNSWFYTRESQARESGYFFFFFFCWPLSHDFLIKCLKAFGEATPIYPKHPRSLSLTFPKQITKDTQILRTCRHVDCRYMHYVHVPFSVLKCDIEVQKNRKKEGRDWFRVLWRGNVWKFGASWYFLNALWKPTEIPAKF